MHAALEALTLAALGVSTTWNALGLAALLRVTRARRSARPAGLSGGTSSLAAGVTTALPPVTVLKPLCGADPSLEANLESCFAQDHPSFEVVLGVENPRDPAVAIARRVMARHPRVPAHLVFTAAHGALNPKVRNLLGMLPHATHDLVLISDANIAAPPHYVRELAALRAESGAGIVTNLFAGVGERGLGSALEATQLNGFCAAGTALPTALGDSLVVGKSMLLSRRELAALGGLGRVQHLLAEDFVLGKTFQHAGHRVVVAPTVLANVIGGTTIAAWYQRHLRWAALRWRLRPAAFLAEPLASPAWLAPLLYLTLGWPGVGAAAAVWLLRDVGGWVALRGWRGAWVPVAVGPLRELGMSLAWLAAPHCRRLGWRGHPLRLGAGTLLYELPDGARAAADTRPLAA